MTPTGSPQKPTLPTAESYGWPIAQSLTSSLGEKRDFEDAIYEKMGFSQKEIDEAWISEDEGLKEKKIKKKKKKSKTEKVVNKKAIKNLFEDKKTEESNGKEKNT